MKLYRKQQDRKQRQHEQDETAYRIAMKIITGQKRVASFLNKKASGLPRWVLLFAFLSCFLSTSAYCIYLLVRVLN
ncbi:hypothetical protein H8S90_01110 [Olivibacter sp. SDN3]|uniref:Uncharacterized protein n=1 Tax=Olivibacter jilunii TaxID=985016 RepID=A0ABW6BB92_9SPHI|nr:hypothetical protein [Olivibacter sp. SDN3]QNL50262.1 hypothetical protein H8S90_01110 [Olivibacter sp. SDN3]